MSPARFRAAGAAGLAALASAAVVAAGSASASAQTDFTVPSSPTNAAKVFQWGSSAWEDEFIDPLSSSWAVSDPEHVRNQHGMLTLEGTSDGQPVTATVADHARRYGRWEARVRSDVKAGGGAPYQVVWELVPRPRAECGDGVTLASYTVGDPVATMDVRTPAGVRFTDEASLDLGQYAWHTYAIEVTRDHVSWFIDTKVVMTERRPDVLSGSRYRVQFRLVPQVGSRMDFTRMQMDWVRYYTLQRPGALPVEAPESVQSSFPAPC